MTTIVQKITKYSFPLFSSTKQSYSEDETFSRRRCDTYKKKTYFVSVWVIVRLTCNTALALCSAMYRGWSFWGSFSKALT